MSKKYELLIGGPVIFALLACGGASTVEVEEPEQETPEVYMVPASRVEVEAETPDPDTKVKKIRTYPDGTRVETETEIEHPDD